MGVKRKKKETENEVQLLVGLEGVVQRHQERRGANDLENLSLCSHVFRGLRLLQERSLPHHLHREQLLVVAAASLPHQKHLPVRCTQHTGIQRYALTHFSWGTADSLVHSHTLE